ncbi:MAG: KH domain-containing protein [Oscillospiraceae bacterium]|nr:KH domain-containing protein [Oscillospiraceae bacterium]
MKELLHYIAINMVDDKDAIEITEIEKDFGSTLQLKVAEGETGRMIGRNGRTAKEIRALMRAANRGGEKVMVDFVD